MRGDMMFMKKKIISDLLLFLILYLIGFVLFYFDQHFPLIISIIGPLVVGVITIIFVEVLIYFRDKKEK